MSVGWEFLFHKFQPWFTDRRRVKSDLGDWVGQCSGAVFEQGKGCTEIIINPFEAIFTETYMKCVVSIRLWVSWSIFTRGLTIRKGSET